MFCLKERKMRGINLPKKTQKSLSLRIKKRKQKKLQEEIAGLMLVPTMVKKALEVEVLGVVI